MKGKGLLVLLLPIVIGVGLSLVFNSGWLPNPIVYLRADVGALLVLMGSGVALVMLIGFITWTRGGQRAERDARVWLAADRRHFVRRLDHEL